MHFTKRIAQALVAAGLVLVMTIGTAFASSGSATVTADALRLRSEPNTNCKTLAMVYKGSSVELLSEEEDGWYKVSYKGTVGYMSAEWLKVVSTASASDQTAQEPADEPAQPKSELVPVVNAGPLNVRSGPGTDYDRIGSLNKGTKVTILETLDGWYKISCGSLTGYVSADYVSMVEQVVVDTASETPINEDGIVLSGPLNLRTGPAATYSLVTSLRTGTPLKVHASCNGWYRVTTNNNLSGYVHGDYVVFLKDLKSSPVGAAAAAMAEALVGCRYVYGAEGPTTFDCSGLAYYIYGQLGYSIARGSSGQYLRSGRFVPMSEMEPGDLIFIFDPKFDGSGGQYPTTHMGIYVGNGKFVHASTTSYTVQYDNVYNSYYTQYIVGVKRIG